MTTQEIADRFYQLSQQNKYEAIQDELYANHAVSIEPPHAAAQGFQNAEGLEGIKKAEAFNNTVEEMHGGYASQPVVGGNFFSVAMGMDVTMKGAGRMNMDEIAVYEVQDGKIVKEQFFFKNQRLFKSPTFLSLYIQLSFNTIIHSFTNDCTCHYFQEGNHFAMFGIPIMRFNGNYS